MFWWVSMAGQLDQPQQGMGFQPHCTHRQSAEVTTCKGSHQAPNL